MAEPIDGCVRLHLRRDITVVWDRILGRTFRPVYLAAGGRFRRLFRLAVFGSSSGIIWLAGIKSHGFWLLLVRTLRQFAQEKFFVGEVDSHQKVTEHVSAHQAIIFNYGSLF